MSVPAFTLVQGLISGLNYGLLALGLVLIYRTSRVLNFAHGELGVMSAVLLSKLVNDFRLPYWPSMLFVLVLATVVGGGCELALRRLFHRPRLLVMVATIGLTEILFLFTLLPFVRPKSAGDPFPLPFHAHFTIGSGLRAHAFASGDVLILIVAPLVAVAVAAFFALSPYGLAMRAMSENSDSARLSGVWVRRTSTFAWMLAGVLSAVTAILTSPGKSTSFVVVLGPELLLRALAAAMLGAMISMPVAFGAGIGIGVLEQVLEYNFRQTSSIEVVMFALLLAVLFVRVRALRLGPRDEERSSFRFGGETRQLGADQLRAGVGRLGVLGAVALALFLPAVIDNSRAFLFARIFVFAVIALSVTILTGWAGQLSLGQFALVAAGSILTARLAGDVPLVVLLLLAGLLGAAIAVVVGLPALRIRGLYLAVSTLGFALLMQTAVVATPCWRVPLIHQRLCTGLPDPSSTLINRPSLFGIDLHPQRAMYYFALAVLVIAIVITRTWRDRGVARDLIAVRDNEVAAAAMGIRVVRTKLLAFALSGFLAGAAGVCYALVSQRVQATTFPASQSILVVSMVIIGGLGSISGAVLGALFLVGIPAVFGSGPTVQFITSGVGLMFFILYLPDGLASLMRRAGDAVAAALRPRPRPGPATLAQP